MVIDKEDVTDEELEELENAYQMEEKGEETDPEEEEEKKDRNRQEQPMGDVYDVYGKAVAVHSRLTSMTEDYTLTRYNLDIYNLKLPKFIREQRKVLRVIKSYLILPLSALKAFYNTDEKAIEVYKGLWKEYRLIEQLILGELDETVIMGRGSEGEVIEAFLKHGMNEHLREDYDATVEQPTVKNRLMEEGRR